MVSGDEPGIAVAMRRPSNAALGAVVKGAAPMLMQWCCSERVLACVEKGAERGCGRGSVGERPETAGARFLFLLATTLDFEFIELLESTSSSAGGAACLAYAGHRPSSALLSLPHPQAPHRCRDRSFRCTGEVKGAEISLPLARACWR